MGRGFEDAVNASNDMLTAAVARQLESVYCTRCGSRLQVRSIQHKGFDRDTGYPKYDVILGCRHAIIYETSVAGKPWFTWKAPFNRHSVHRISRLIELNLDLADAHYKRGEAHHEIGEYIKAITEYDLAIKLNPNHALAYYNRGAIYSEKGEVVRAIGDLKRCIELSTDPELTEAAQQELHKIGKFP